MINNEREPLRAVYRMQSRLYMSIQVYTVYVVPFWIPLGFQACDERPLHPRKDQVPRDGVKTLSTSKTPWLSFTRLPKVRRPCPSLFHIVPAQSARGDGKILGEALASQVPALEILLEVTNCLTPCLMHFFFGHFGGKVLTCQQSDLCTTVMAK